MHILVTGGAGYVGSVSVEAFIAAGHEVTVLDDLSTGHRGAVPAGAALEVGSYGDIAAVTALLERRRIDAVLHCAAKSLVGESMIDPAKYFRENVSGGIALLDAMRAAGVTAHRLQLDRGDVRHAREDAHPRVGPDPADQRLRRDEALRRGGDRLVRPRLRPAERDPALLQRGRRQPAIRRAARPGDAPHPQVLAAAEEGREVTLFGDDYPTPDGTCVRDYIHVEDLAAAHLAALDGHGPGRSADRPGPGPVPSR